jgi:hypothetical protein
MHIESIGKMNELEISIKLNSDQSEIICRFANLSNGVLRVRKIAPQFDVVIQHSKNPTVAAEYIYHSFMVEVPAVILARAESFEEILRLQEFIFQEPGEYKTWIDYQTDLKKIVVAGTSIVDSIRSTSNVLQIDIAESRCEKITQYGDPEVFRRYLENQKRKKWWQFWK